jgi:hypothetical protein
MFIRSSVRCAAAVFLAGSAWGGAIITTAVNGSTGSGGGPFAVSWTQTGSYTNVAIGAVLASDNGLSTATGTAYLMNLIGPSATSANEVTTPFTGIAAGGNNSLSEVPLFSGLSLGPGTYYLVIVPADFNQVDSLDWDFTTTAAVTLGSGVTENSDQVVSGSPAGFGPASTFVTEANHQLFSVTGDASQGPPPPSGAPEPSTVMMMAGGLAAIGTFARRSRS